MAGCLYMTDSDIVTEVRRRVVGVAAGAARLLVEAQASFDDVMGAVEEAEWELAAYEARVLATTCLSILSLQTEGEPFAFFGDLATFDPFAGLDPLRVFEATELANSALDLGSGNVGAWVDGIRSLLADAELALNLSEPLPELRSPDGLFSVMRLARDWLKAVEDLRLPPILPAEWTQNL